MKREKEKSICEFDELIPGENKQLRADRKLIDRAKFEAGENDFIISCEKYLNKNSFLTDKQRSALEDIADGTAYEDNAYDYDHYYGRDW